MKSRRFLRSTTRSPRLRASRLAATAATVLVLAACSGGMTTGSLRGEVLETPTPKPSFTLTDMNGDPFDFQAETEGKLTLLYFGYTYCPDICPVHFAQIAEVIEQYPSLSRNLQVVFVTVDPGRDTTERVREFLGRWGPQYIGLTGTPDELAAAQNAVGVPVARLNLEEGENYSVDHSSVVFAYAADGMSYSVYPFGTRQTTWTNDLEVLSKIEKDSG